MRKKLDFQCPCGYVFEMFGQNKDAISMIKSHFESFHKHYLPFGITNEEALALLKEGNEKTKISKRDAYLAPTKTDYSFREKASTLQLLLDKLLGEDVEKDYGRKRERKALSIQ